MVCPRERQLDVCACLVLCRGSGACRPSGFCIPITYLPTRPLSLVWPVVGSLKRGGGALLGNFFGAQSLEIQERKGGGGGNI